MKIAKSLGQKYKNKNLSAEDIEQECIFKALLAIKTGKYDPARPLENFMRVHLKRRALNYCRDNNKYGRPKNIDGVNPSYTVDHDERITNSDLMEELEARVPADMRADFLKLRAGQSIPSHRKKKLLAILKGEECEKESGPSKKSNTSETI